MLADVIRSMCAQVQRAASGRTLHADLYFCTHTLCGYTMTPCVLGSVEFQLHWKRLDRNPLKFSADIILKDE